MWAEKIGPVNFSLIKPNPGFKFNSILICLSFINSKGNYTYPSIHHPNYNYNFDFQTGCNIFRKGKNKSKTNLRQCCVGLVRLPIGHGGAVGKGIYFFF
jgi:hypothetical protein